MTIIHFRWPNLSVKIPAIGLNIANKTQFMFPITKVRNFSSFRFLEPIILKLVIVQNENSYDKYDIKKIYQNVVDFNPSIKL